MDQAMVIEKLKSEAQSNKAANAVLHVFAARRRARHVVTVQALAQRMKEEGFEFQQSEYEGVLKMLANLGIGKLDTDHKGRVRALKEVKTTLQSIGLAAVGNAPAMDGFKPRNRFQRIPIIEAASVTRAPTVVHVNGFKERVQPRPPAGVWEVLCVPLKSGNTFKTYVPKDLTKEDAALIGRALSDMAKGTP